MNRVESQMAELCGLARRMDGLVPDTAALLREVADTLGQLKVENAKLREELEAVGTAAYLYGRDDLKAENARLHELVQDMLDCIEIRSAFGRPFTSEIYESFAQRACELGVEVDE